MSTNFFINVNYPNYTQPDLSYFEKLSIWLTKKDWRVEEYCSRRNTFYTNIGKIHGFITSIGRDHELYIRIEMVDKFLVSVTTTNIPSNLAIRDTFSIYALDKQSEIDSIIWLLGQRIDLLLKSGKEQNPYE